MLLRDDLVFMFVDTETTGFDKAKDKVCQLGAVWAKGDGVPIKTFDSYVSPGIPIPAEASAVHHIVDEDVAGAPGIAIALEQMLATHPYDVAVFHNRDYDTQFINVPGLVLCSLKIARHIYPDADYHKLQFLRYWLKLDVPEARGQMAHSALADCYVTAKLFAKELEELDGTKTKEVLDLAAVREWAERPVLQKKCNFGKHRGTPWGEVPKSYITWALGNMKDLDGDLLHTLKYWGNR